jgi:hypothetical protein
MRSLTTSACLLFVIGSLAACTTPRTIVGHDAGHGGGGDGGGPTSCGAGTTSICRGSGSIACNADGSEGAVTDCGSGACVPNMGCRVCQPGAGNCQGNDVRQCRNDGSGYDTVTTCDPSSGQMCSASLIRCSSPCADAEATNSYIGCEYWPVPTLNNEIDRTMFHFAVAVANPGTSPATVTIDRGGAPVATRTVAGGALEVIQLPWDNNLQPMGDMTTGLVPSVLEHHGAYHMVSTVPVTVYQFNPLEYETGTFVPTNSFSNDASLLLPNHVLTGNYIVMSRATHQFHILYRSHNPPHTVPTGGDLTAASPGFFTLVGTADATSVQITFTAHVMASLDSAVMAYGPGQTGTFTLNRGDVLQIATSAPATCVDSGMFDTQANYDIIGATVYDREIHYCTVGNDYDLTGTQIRASSPLSLINGHNCAFVPFNRWACDHLEEVDFPLETWGTSALVAVTQPLRTEPNIIRIVSGDDGNAITFDPASVHAGTTLNRGEFIEFEAAASFRVAGTDSISVAQFLVGQDYGGFGSSAMGASGDPSQSLAIPTEQYRTSYTFLAPDTYASNFVGVSAPSGVEVDLDGAAMGGFAPVGGTGFGVANTSISGGVHTITSSSPFGIVVYGFGAYTSYMYPGGLDLQRINVPF